MLSLLKITFQPKNRGQVKGLHDALQKICAVTDILYWTEDLWLYKSHIVLDVHEMFPLNPFALNYFYEGASNPGTQG